MSQLQSLSQKQLNPASADPTLPKIVTNHSEKTPVSKSEILVKLDVARITGDEIEWPFCLAPRSEHLEMKYEASALPSVPITMIYGSSRGSLVIKIIY
jgi:hypothetical protein